MALECKVGSFTPASGSQTIDPGFQPKALILWTSARTADGGGSDHARLSYGHATDRGGTASQYHWCFASEDVAGTADCYDGSSTASILKLTNGTTATVVFNMSFTEFVAGGFTVNVTTATLLPVVNYIAIGGTDVADALAGQTNWSVSTGNQDVTVASGFGQPDLVVFPLSWHGASTPATQDAMEMLGFGIKSGAANGRAMLLGSQDNAATQATQQRISNNRAGTITWGIGSADTEWEVAASSAWPTDGFRINRTLGASGTGWPFFWLAIKFSADVTVTAGEAAAATTLDGTNTLTSSGTPKLALALMTRQTTANSLDTTSTNCMFAGIGACDGDGNERFAAVYDDDGQATAAVCGTAQSSTKGIQTWLPSSDTLDGEADIAVSGSNFVATWTDPAPSAFLYEWLTLGVAGGGGAPAVVRMLGTLGAGQ